MSESRAMIDLDLWLSRDQIDGLGELMYSVLGSAEVTAAQAANPDGVAALYVIYGALVQARDAGAKS
jgi:hypothetical protein